MLFLQVFMVGMLQVLCDVAREWLCGASAGLVWCLQIFFVDNGSLVEYSYKVYIGSIEDR